MRTFAFVLAAGSLLASCHKLPPPPAPVAPDPQPASLKIIGANVYLTAPDNKSVTFTIRNHAGKVVTGKQALVENYFPPCRDLQGVIYSQEQLAKIALCINDAASKKDDFFLQ